MSAALQLYCGEKRLESKKQDSVCWSIFVPTITRGHELWVVTERTRSQIEAAEMSFHRRVAGFLSEVGHLGENCCSSTSIGAN